VPLCSWPLLQSYARSPTSTMSISTMTVYVTARRVQAGLTWDGIDVGLHHGPRGLLAPVFLALALMLDCSSSGRRRRPPPYESRPYTRPTRCSSSARARADRRRLDARSWLRCSRSTTARRVGGVGGEGRMCSVTDLARRAEALCQLFSRRPGGRRLVLVEVAFSIGLPG